MNDIQSEPTTLPPEAATAPEAGAAEPSVAPAEPPAAETSGAAPVTVAELSPAEVAAKLKSLFPGLFAGAYKPLKLRVQADIQQRAPGQFTKAQLSAFLRRHTGSTGYLIALSKAKNRFDLDGQPGDELSDEHRKVAQDELNRRRGVQQERVALEAEQRHNRAGLLRDYERTTLTLPNFCALKGVTPEELPGLLEIARAEALQAPAEAPRRPERPRRDQRDQRGRPDGGRRPAPRSGEARPPRPPKAQS
jgi:ProP effector